MIIVTEWKMTGTELRREGADLVSGIAIKTTVMLKRSTKRQQPTEKVKESKPRTRLVPLDDEGTRAVKAVHNLAASKVLVRAPTRI